MAGEMISVSDVTFAYPDGIPILKHFRWDVVPGDAWAVIGPSGCGKSTLLMLVAGLRQPAAGQVLVDGLPIERPRPRTGLILQDYGLLPWATVWDNAALGLKIRGFYGADGRHTPSDESLPRRRSAAFQAAVAERVNGWLARLTIDHVANHYPNQISGGQRQRTAIARTLVMQPDLLLMDEPFGALDALTREDLQRLTLELGQEQNLTMVLVTHNIEEAAMMGRKILVLGMPPNDGAIVVSNPGAGQPDHRTSSAFFACCNHLRTLLGEAGNALA